MGLSSKKQTTKETSQQSGTQQSTATTSNTVPDWIKQPTMNVAGQIGGLLDQGAGAYTPQMSGLQQEAVARAGGLKTSPYFQQAGDALGNVGDVAYTPYSAQTFDAQSLLDGLDKYYNPFKEQVLNPVLNDYDVQSDETRAAQAADAARNRSFQGSRYGVQEAATEGQLARGRAATEGGLLGQMYTQATGLSATDAAARQQAAAANAAAANQAAAANAQGTFAAAQANQAAQLQRAQQLAALGATQGSEERANLGVQAGLGGVLTDFENTQRQYPIQFLQQNEGLLSGLNPELYTNKTINTSGSNTATGSSTSQSKQSDFLGGLGQAAQIAAILSDRRLKTRIRDLFRDWKGRRWVEFAYRWAPDIRRVGLIAQDVLKSDQEAVIRLPNGYLAVDYGSLV